MGLFDIFKKSKKKSVSAPVPQKEVFTHVAPSYDDNLSSSEKSFLSYCHGKSADFSTYSQFYKYKHGLDYGYEINKFLRLNLLEHAGLSLTIDSYALPDIKAFMKANNLSVSGKKADLISRILTQCPDELIRSYFNKKVFALTEEGSDIVRQHLSECAESYKIFLTELFSAVTRKDVETAFRLVGTSTVPSDNPIALPYDKSAVKSDIDAIHAFLSADGRTSAEDFASATYSTMLHSPLTKHSIEDLASLGYTVTKEQLIRDSTGVVNARTLAEFKQVHIYKYKISCCDDQRSCSKCKKLNGKVFSVNSAEMGKNLPPFCDHCRCIIIPVVD